jgi:hypothetical protein
LGGVAMLFLAARRRSSARRGALSAAKRN